MRIVAVLLWMLLLSAPISLAGDTVIVTVYGTVEENQIAGAPLGNVQVDDAVTMTLVLNTSNFVDSTNFPVRGYIIEHASYSLELGSEEIGLQDPFPGGETPYFVIRNDDPATDGFFTGSNIDGFNDGNPLDQVGVFGNFRNNFSVSYGNDPWPSLDIVDALGSYDFTGLTVFGWAIDDGPFNPMLIVFESMTVELGVPLTPPAVPDGSDGVPLIVQKNPNNDSVLRLLFDTDSCVGNESHHLIYGFGSQLPTGPAQSFLINGSACTVNGSPFNWLGVPDPSIDSSALLWFLMLANDEATTEGSWGTDSSGAERIGPGAGGVSNECLMELKDLGNVCGQ